MAATVIEFRTGGSDTDESGNGPVPAIKGAVAALFADQSYIGLHDASDLTGVVVGNVIFLNTSSGPAFFRINAVKNTVETGEVTVDPDGITCTVTSGTIPVGGCPVDVAGNIRYCVSGGADYFVLNASITQTGSNRAFTFPRYVSTDATMSSAATGTYGWGVGGYRLAMNNAQSYKLVNKSSAAGDAGGGGWELHVYNNQTLSAQYKIYAAASTTMVPLKIKFFNGVTVTTSYGAGNAFDSTNGYVVIEDADVRSSYGTKSSNSHIAFGADGGFTKLVNCKIGGDSTSEGFYRAVRSGSNCRFSLIDCEAGYCYDNGVVVGAASVEIIGGSYHHNGQSGINCGGSGTWTIIGATCTNNGVHGIITANSATSRGGIPVVRIIGNTLDGNDGDGYRNNSTTAQFGGLGIYFKNNHCTNNGGLGTNFSGTGMTAGILAAAVPEIQGTNCYGNTGGDCNLDLTGIERGKKNTDPAFTDRTNATYTLRDYTPTVTGTGWPQTVKGTATQNRPTIGAVQPAVGTGGASYAGVESTGVIEMKKNTAAWVYYTAVSSTGAAQLSDKANHTIKIAANGSEATATNNGHTTNHVELSGGRYGIYLTAAETNYDSIQVGGTSSTSGVRISAITIGLGDAEAQATTAATQATNAATDADAIEQRLTAARAGKLDNIPAGTMPLKSETDAIKTVADAVKLKTDNLPSDPASVTKQDAAKTVIDATKTIVDAITLKTANIPASPAQEATAQTAATQATTAATQSTSAASDAAAIKARTPSTGTMATATNVTDAQGVITDAIAGIVIELSPEDIATIAEDVSAALVESGIPSAADNAAATKTAILGITTTEVVAATGSWWNRLYKRLRQKV